jgi:erythritol kinase (D-erythritol 1-phosphate-forming)
LRAGTPVVAGVLDVVANALGVGAIDRGQAMVILGTTALAAVILDEPRFEPADVGASVCHAPDGRWMRALGSMAGTPNLDWLLQTMGRGVADEASAAGRNPYAMLEDEIAASPPGANGLVYHPFLLGERVPFIDPDARGSIFGLSMATSRGDVARAVSEGVAFAVRHCLGAIGTPVSEIRLCGGGARSVTWSQILADVTGARMTVASGKQFGALGAAMVAGIGIGLFPDYATAVDSCVRLARVHEPDPDAHALYVERFAIYSDLIEAMRPHWPRLADTGRDGRSTPRQT